MYTFDEDTRVERQSPGIFQAEVTPHWNVGPVPNGGYVLAVGLAAVQEVLTPPDPVTVTAHYLRPTLVGPATIEVTKIKEGRHATAMAMLTQDGKERVRILATYGDLAEADGPQHIAGAPPEVDRVIFGEDGRPKPPFPVEIHKRFDVQMDKVDSPFGARDRARLAARVRFADGREPDIHSLAVFADSMPPPVFRVTQPGWVPTMELTVHFRARPEPGWLKVAFETRFLFDGYLEEDGEIWDASGQLVALSRQLAGAPRPF